MDDDRTAEHRITGAMARINAAADRIAASASTNSPANAALAVSHENLREEAAQAISELDQLIGTLSS